MNQHRVLMVNKANQIKIAFQQNLPIQDNIVQGTIKQKQGFSEQPVRTTYLKNMESSTQGQYQSTEKQSLSKQDGQQNFQYKKFPNQSNYQNGQQEQYKQENNLKEKQQPGFRINNRPPSPQINKNGSYLTTYQKQNTNDKGHIELQELQNQLIQLTQELQQLSMIKTSIEKAYLQEKKINEELQQKVNSQSTEIGNLQGLLQSRNQEIQQLKQQIPSEFNLQNQKGKQFNELQEEIRKLNYIISQCKCQFYQEEYQKNRESQKINQSKIEELQNKIKFEQEKTQNEFKYEQKCISLQNQLEEEKSNHQKYVDQLSAQLNSQKQLIEKYNKEIEEKNLLIAQSLRQIDKLNLELQSKLEFKEKLLEQENFIEIIQQNNQDLKNQIKLLEKQQLQFKDSQIKPQQQQNSQLQQQSVTISKYKPNQLISVIVGQPGVGKNTFLQRLFDGQKITEYQVKEHTELKCSFVNTEAFDFETDIEQREKLIIKFRELFLKQQQNIINLYILVNFERTDLMKRKITSVYKFIRQFQPLISIIVTSFDLSESKEQDEQDLRSKFAIYKPNEIYFFGKNTSKSEMIKQLRQQCTTNKEEKINLEGTIFADEDQEEQKQIMDSFKKSFQQKMK